MHALAIKMFSSEFKTYERFRDIFDVIATKLPRELLIASFEIPQKEKRKEIKLKLIEKEREKENNSKTEPKMKSQLYKT